MNPRIKLIAKLFSHYYCLARVTQDYLKFNPELITSTMYFDYLVYLSSHFVKLGNLCFHLLGGFNRRNYLLGVRYYNKRVIFNIKHSIDSNHTLEEVIDVFAGDFQVLFQYASTLTDCKEYRCSITIDGSVKQSILHNKLGGLRDLMHNTTNILNCYGVYVPYVNNLPPSECLEFFQDVKTLLAKELVYLRDVKGREVNITNYILEDDKLRVIQTVSKIQIFD